MTKPIIRNRGRAALLTTLMVLLSGCFGVPTMELEAYRQNFDTVRTTATDLYLQTDIYAEELADNPANAASVTTRLQDLQQRKNDIQLRLGALKIISTYNDVLSALASGSDTDAIAGNLNTLQSDLKSFKIDELTSVLNKVAPYTGVTSAAIGLIDDAIQAKKFKDAVYAAEPLIAGILTTLEKDAETIHANIVTPRLREAWSAQHFSKIASLRHEFQAATKPYNNSLPADLANEAAIRNVAALYTAFNAEQTALKAWPKLTPLPPLNRGTPGAQTPTTATLVSLEGLVRDLHDHVAAANKILTSLNDHQGYIVSYKNALNGVGTAFTTMKTAIETNRTADITTFAFKVLELRKAYLKIRKDTAS